MSTNNPGTPPVRFKVLVSQPIGSTSAILPATPVECRPWFPVVSPRELLLPVGDLLNIRRHVVLPVGIAAIEIFSFASHIVVPGK